MSEETESRGYGHYRLRRLCGLRHLQRGRGPGHLQPHRRPEYRFVSDPAGQTPQFDVVLMEGLVASPRDLEMLKDISAHTKVLVALGTCAHTGNIPAYKKWTPKENFAHLEYDK